MLANIGDIADSGDVGTELLFKLQIELLNESRSELWSFGHKRQSRNAGEVRNIWRRRGRQSLIKGSWPTRNSRTTWVLRPGIHAQILFNLNRDVGLTVGAEDGSKWSILQIGVGGVVAREEA